jgi:hypothetical protein
MRTVALGIATAVAVVLVLLGHTFGRAETTHTYRPDVPPAALDNGCFPLPHGLHLDFDYQVRADGDIPVGSGSRRTLLMQFDLISLDQVRARLVGDFRRAGFKRIGSDRGDRLMFRRADTGTVSAVLAPLPDLIPGAIVQGTITFALPSIPQQGSSLACDDPYSTKRFPPDWKLRHL